MCFILLQVGLGPGKLVLPVMPRHVAADGKVGLALPSSFAEVMPCSPCPWCSPLPRTQLPIVAPCPRPCLRMRLPYWTDWGARETDARSLGDWKTAVLLDLLEIQSYASGCGLCAGSQSEQSKAWNFPCLLICTRPFLAVPGLGSWGLLQSG